jgi:hypothetical protein
MFFSPLAPCFLFLELAIIAGNPLKGKVIVKVKKDLPPTKLLLQLKGEEKSKVVHGSGKHKRTGSATRVICGATAVLRQEGGATIRAGTYVFPFEIMLHASLPSSMQGKGNQGSNCSIFYRLSVDAHYNGKTVSKVAKCYFNVASTPLPDELVPAFVAPKSFRLESFGMNRGTLSIGARVIDIHVGRGTDLMIYLACRNDATASIYRVEIELIQNLSWYAHSNRSNSDTRTIAHLPDVDLPGIVRGKKDKEQVREQIRQGGVQPHELQGLYNALQSKENMVILNIPEGCRDTYNGPLIKIKHYLKITMYTKSLISNPSIEIPLRIGFPPQVGRRQFPQPLAPPQPRVQSPPAWSEDPRNLMPSPFAPPAFAPSSQQQYSVPAMASAQPLPVAQPYQSQVRNRNMTIPMAEAVLIPTEDAIQAPMASAPPEAMVLGGNAFYSEVESSMEIPTLARPSSGPAIDGLLEEMVFSINDFEIIDGNYVMRTGPACCR